jgi:hypothetical protein
MISPSAISPRGGTVPVDDRVVDLMSRMTLVEKVSQLYGRGHWA